MAKILVVDDDPGIVDACRLFLEGEGHQVDAAYNRTEGLKAVESVKPDLLILDVMMEQPDDGLAMAQELRRNGNNLPILMLTSMGKVLGMDFDKDGDLIPVDEFIEKPVSPDVLLATVARLLDK